MYLVLMLLLFNCNSMQLESDNEMDYADINEFGHEHNQTGRELESRIIKGQKAYIEDYPHQVIIANDGILCGGFIVSKNYILTAAHCAENLDPSKITLKAGSTFINKGTVIPIAQVIKHPGYDNQIKDKDAAVMRTVNPIKYTETIQPIRLPRRNRSVKAGSKIYISGWGDTSPDASRPPMSDHLMEVRLTVVYRTLCRHSYKKVLSNNMFCAGNYFTGGPSPCAGDSGGAAIQDGQAVGIVSFVLKNCGDPLKPAVFADVSSPAIRDFITKETGL